MKLLLVVAAVCLFDIGRTFPLTGMSIQRGMPWQDAQQTLSDAGYDPYRTEKGWFQSSHVGEWNFAMASDKGSPALVQSMYLSLRIGNSEVYYDPFFLYFDQEGTKLVLFGFSMEW